MVNRLMSPVSTTFHVVCYWSRVPVLENYQVPSQKLGVIHHCVLCTRKALNSTLVSAPKASGAIGPATKPQIGPIHTIPLAVVCALLLISCQA
jgi:hypothetical protein